MKCRYCGEEGHKIQDCDKGLYLNKILESPIKPNLLTMNSKDLQRIASLNNIKYYLSKKELIIEITNLWIEKDKIRNTLYNSVECCICYDTIYNNNNTVLSCGHKYHFECILLALNKKLFCPMCRIDITFTQFKFNNEIYEDEDVITTDMVNILTNLNNMNNNMNVHEIIDVNNTINNDESLYNHNMSYNDSIANLKFAIYLYTCFKKHHQFFLFLFGLSILYTYFDTIIITISNNKTMEYMEYIDDIL
jgi:hypothetical protein